MVFQLLLGGYKVVVINNLNNSSAVAIKQVQELVGNLKKDWQRGRGNGRGGNSGGKGLESGDSEPPPSSMHGQGWQQAASGNGLGCEGGVESGGGWKSCTVIVMVVMGVSCNMCKRVRMEMEVEES
ncbi:hypothetical protein LOK49_LG08G01707 [Camellia lanceoleosa]|uniref:Uncharacterized protein n=1 Tax=Camellia lanceoleosa TaxID=1840588 RepID=A0ACC0GS74_9ERIC|nr:hypothetical protein LOK49_LG08G01707 [Camellia lanceoleosa]